MHTAMLMPSADPAPTAFDALATVVLERDALQVRFDAAGPIDSVDLLLEDLAPPSASPAERAAHRAAVNKRRGGAGRAVLIVDGSAIARKFLSHRLQDLGYVVHTAETGERALVLVGQQAFSIVFTEFVLAARPGLDGLGLCHAIKQMPEHPRGIGPAVVVVAGRAASADQVRASLAGCAAFLTKPLAEAALIAALGEVDPLFS